VERPGEVVGEDCENRRVDERRRLGVVDGERRRDSRRREIGSSDVRVRLRKRVEKSGVGGGGAALDFVE
jgi:hypothetical protein